MQRWAYLAAFSALLLAVPGWAQRGGRGAMGMRGGRGYAAAARGPEYGPRTGWGHGPYMHPGHPVYGRPGRYPYRPGRFIRPYYPWRYPWFYASYGGLGWYSGDYADYAAPVQPMPAYTYPDTSSYALYQQQQQIDELSDEVARLQSERIPAPQDYVRRLPGSQMPAETVLVFRDHHTEEVANYAVVGRTLWIFNEQRARKFALADLDVPATTKANEDRGIVFSAPSR